MNIVFFDTETTGLLLPDNAPLNLQPKIIEFYGVRIDENFKILAEVDHLIYPGEEISKEIEQITGIKNSDLKGKPEFEDVAHKINELFKDSDLSVAHNIGFDNGMLENEFKRVCCIRNRSVFDYCTVDNLIPYLGHRISLGALYKKLFNASFTAHRAKSDVFALVRIYHHLLEIGVISNELYKN